MSSPWSISVKTVGNQDASDFTINVSPEDDLKCLHEQIEEFTGLKASQQRLIYRGRLIGNCKQQPPVEVEASVQKNEPKVRDVIGLCDGQTIHLVPRPAEEEPQPERAPEVPSSRRNNDERNSPSSVPSPSSSSGTAALLAALLGIGSDDNDDDEGSGSNLGQLQQRLRSARIRNRSRRPNHRLTASDTQVQDPGTVEPVRQGLMTLHTLLQAHQLDVNSNQTLFHNRHWYRGQWIDCRDTVNQWLEATIVDIVRPEDILPSQLQRQPSRRRRRIVEPTTDAAVSANDFEGRMRLLLEPGEGDPFEDEWGGYRARDNNDGVSLLLIHYNGWPHRWDEWIRSDSERMRPFRTRTRHPNNSSTACPTPQSAFNAAPSTHFKEENEPSDRQALLPELQRIMTIVNDMVTQSVELIDSPEQAERDDDLPWLGTPRDDNSLPPLVSNETGEIHTENNSQNGPELRRQLQMLAPLLDRLGRTLTDAAPHIASYAASLPESAPAEPMRLSPSEPNVHIVGDIPDDLPDSEDNSEKGTRGEILSEQEATSCDSELRREPIEATVPLLSDEAREIEDEPVVIDPTPEPDYVDFVNGRVNTTRGEVRTRGARSSSSSNDDASSLLGAYLAAASLGSLVNNDDNDNDSGLQGLGRLLRQRENNGGNGGGIDIHIHAIVTGPGMGAGGGGMAIIGGETGGGGGLGGGEGGGSPTTTTVTPTNVRPSLFSSSSRSNAITPDSPRVTQITQNDDDELGIFEDLYSENPAPIDLENGIVPSDENALNVVSGSLPIEDSDSTGSEEFIRRLSNPLARSGLTISSIDSPPRSPNRRHHSTSSLVLGGPPTRRGSVISRLFRRISSRRGGSNADQTQE